VRRVRWRRVWGRSAGRAGRSLAGGRGSHLHGPCGFRCSGAGGPRGADSPSAGGGPGSGWSGPAFGRGRGFPSALPVRPWSPGAGGPGGADSPSAGAGPGRAGLWRGRRFRPARPVRFSLSGAGGPSAVDSLSADVRLRGPSAGGGISIRTARAALAAGCGWSRWGGFAVGGRGVVRPSAGAGVPIRVIRAGFVVGCGWGRFAVGGRGRPGSGGRWCRGVASVLVRVGLAGSRLLRKIPRSKAGASRSAARVIREAAAR
jgi:hypothetical protein